MKLVLPTLLAAALVAGAVPALAVQAPPVVTATGWSNADDEAAAAREAVAAVRKGVARPKLVVLFSTVGYDVRKVLAGVGAGLPGAKVFGVTSCTRVATETGVHLGKRKGVMAVMGLDAADLAVGVGTGAIASPGRARQVAREAIARAIANAGKRPGEKPALVLMGSTPGNEERVIEGIASVFGKDVPVYGGSAADDDITGKWLTMGNGQALPSGVSVALLYTKHPIGASFASGYLGSQEAGHVTAMKGRTLLTIDHRPAGEVYDEWSGHAFTGPMATGGSILAPSAFMPLAKAIVTQTGEKWFVSLHPSRIDPKTRSLDLFGEANDQEPIYFLKGNADSLIQRASAVTRRALVEGRIKRADVAGGIHIYCGGAMLAVKDRVGEIVPGINQVLGRKPFIGAFTFGEQGDFKGYGNFHGNLMTSTVVFGRR